MTGSGSGQDDMRRLPPGQSSNPLPGMAVRHGASMLIADAVGDRFRNGAGAAGNGTMGCPALNQINEY